MYLRELSLLSVVCTISIGITAGHATASFAQAKRDVGQDSPSDSISIPKTVQAHFQTYCGDCHNADYAESDVVIADRSSLNIATLNRIQDQLFFELMPPEDGVPLSPEDHEALASWIRTQLQERNASQLDDRLRYPSYGNLLDHERLFSGEVQQKAYTPARRWLVSPQIFHDRVMAVFKLSGWDRDSQKHRTFAGVTNPVLLPDRSGVRYFDDAMLDGGHLLVMLGNAEWIADRQLLIARYLGGDRRTIEFDDPRDRWLPRKWPESYAAFQAILRTEGEPSIEMMEAAIREQFDCVLQRSPSSDELARYLEFLRTSIELSSNRQGLRQMMIAVLLESEFLYRLEFGGGQPDEFGRKKLTPREASFAISYALGDRGPDPLLLQAAEEGRLATKADYEREVRRLLEDQEYYRGQIDPTLNGKHYQSNETSHPRIVRFFRDFFGYPGCLKVFKDSARGEGKYQNPGRGSQGTPGWLTLEADRFVTRHIEADQHVFERLLTSNEFFVYHDKSNEDGQKIIEDWKSVYEKLKDEDWKHNPEQVLQDNLAFLKAVPSMRIQDASRPGELVNYMHYFEESFGQGRTPFTTVPWAHGYTFHHSIFYGLPPTPSIGRYGSWKSTKYQDQLDAKEFWDYPTKQPFAIEHRKGILTHPAWLIAHSSNFHPDPIRRGRWIREKLLAGRVPDVPITVDAQVPEHPEKTFRQRVEEVTSAGECWKCHKQMNPLGLAFEMYDDFGRYRLEEKLEHPDNLIRAGDGKSTFDIYPTLPVDSTGELTGTCDLTLDGRVDNALTMIDRLAQSEHVRQSIIRHAFRFFMGRNEMISDSQTLIDADRAYVDSGGSFKEVVVSLLTSDSFMYRKQTKE